MKSVLTSLRTTLEKNKIFFEIFVAIALSSMAIILSWQANKIAQNQTDLMQAESQPQLEIRMTQEFNSNLSIYDNYTWYFFNHGGSLSNFETEDYSFFEFTFRDNSETVSIPIYGYFNFQGVLTGESQGLIYQIDNDHNGKKYLELRDSLSSLGYCSVNSYVAVKYRDVFSKNHEEYFQLSPGIEKLSGQKWLEIKNGHLKTDFTKSFVHLYATEIIHRINVIHH